MKQAKREKKVPIYCVALIPDVFVQKHIDEVAHLSKESLTFKRKKKIKTSKGGKREVGGRHRLDALVVAVKAQCQ